MKNINYLEIIKKSIDEVILKNKGEIYIQTIKEDNANHEYILQEVNIRKFDTRSGYNIDDLIVKDIWGKINTSLEEAVCDIDSPCEKFLCDLYNNEEDMWDIVAEEREIFKEVFRTKDIEKFITKKLSQANE